MNQLHSVCNRFCPTLCSLTGIEVPQHVEGANITPLLLDPKANWDKPAVITYHLNNHSIRTERWRYIHYAEGGEELYDHDNDPYEWKNLAADPQFSETKKSLAKLMPVSNVAERPRDGQ